MHYVVSGQLAKLKFDNYYELTTKDKIKFDAIFEVLCEFDADECVTLSKRLFNQWRKESVNRYKKITHLFRHFVN